MTNSDSPYSTTFYAGQRDASYEAAETILPLILDLVKPSSIVDVGCGVGAWLAAARKLGVARTVGIEGSWVRASELLDRNITLVNHDLERPIPTTERFDLAMSLEVAEHLTPARAESFVADLCRMAPAVLFGAAVPGQGGVRHLNERRQSYWADLFLRNDFKLLDVVRARFWSADAVPVHYRQNTFLYVHSSVFSTYAVAPSWPAFPLDVVHPLVLESNYAELVAPATLGQSLRIIARLPLAVWRSLVARLGRSRNR